jgi:hypothetical protein
MRDHSLDARQFAEARNQGFDRTARVPAAPERLDHRVADLDNAVVAQRAPDLPDDELILQALNEEGTELGGVTDVLGDADREFRGVAGSDPKRPRVGGPCGSPPPRARLSVSAPRLARRSCRGGQA